MQAEEPTKYRTVTVDEVTKSIEAAGEAITSMGIQAKSVEEQARKMGMTLVREKGTIRRTRPTNKFLGSDKPRLSAKNFHGEPRRGNRNPNGVGLVRAASDQVSKRLAEVMGRRQGSLVK